MKTITIILTAIIFSIGMPQKKGQIEIRFKDCRNDDLIYNKVIQLKSQNGKSIERVITRKDNKIKKLEPGNYEIEFESIFGRKEVEKVTVEHGKKIELEICVNKFTSDKEQITKITIIDSIAINEQYKITYESRGCLHFNQDSIEIKRDENGFFYKSKDSWIRLTENQIESIRDFEMKLFNNKILDGCTTSETYGLKYKDVHGVVTIDGGCRWRGGKYIKNKLTKDNKCLDVYELISERWSYKHKGNYYEVDPSIRSFFYEDKECLYELNKKELIKLLGKPSVDKGLKLKYYGDTKCNNQPLKTCYLYTFTFDEISGKLSKITAKGF